MQLLWQREKLHTGCARQMGQTLALGAALAVEQLQKAFVAVFSCTWHSMPITASNATCMGQGMHRMAHCFVALTLHADMTGAAAYLWLCHDSCRCSSCTDSMLPRLCRPPAAGKL